jgi:hypothetical protein
MPRNKNYIVLSVNSLIIEAIQGVVQNSGVEIRISNEAYRKINKSKNFIINRLLRNISVLVSIFVNKSSAF